tara:strand:- start:12389 stop:12712 length:324 start_codon:yes stop_codon:yes gene_type:complete
VHLCVPFVLSLLTFNISIIGNISRIFIEKHQISYKNSLPCMGRPSLFCGSFRRLIAVDFNAIFVNLDGEIGSIIGWSANIGELNHTESNHSHNKRANDKIEETIVSA